MACASLLTIACGEKYNCNLLLKYANGKGHGSMHCIRACSIWKDVCLRSAEYCGNQELSFVRDGISTQGLSNLNFERP